MFHSYNNLMKRLLLLLKFKMCGQNRTVLPLKWNLFGTAPAQCYLLPKILQNEIWFLGEFFTLVTVSEKLNETMLSSGDTNVLCANAW